MTVQGLRASGIGSWPGADPRTAQHAIRDLLAVDQLPYLPELPDRGPGADLVGRTASHLEGLAIDLQPSGWRLTDAPGHDARRGRSHLRADLDELAETYDGYAGPLKVQLAGPLTLAAAVRLPRGERVLADAGALRDVTQSLAETAAAHVADCARLLPRARIVLQLDEPGLPSVLSGSLPTDSGFGRLPTLDPQRVRELLGEVVQRVRAADTPVVLHCCGADVPLALLRRIDGLSVALDTSLLSGQGWDRVAEAMDSREGADAVDGPLWPGLLPTDSRERHPRRHVEAFLDALRRTGMPAAAVLPAVVTPACGLAACTPDDALRLTRLTIEATRMLQEAALS